MKVSVILTSYNHAEFIGSAIESVLNQTYKDFELIIIDDNSTDNSCEIIESYNDDRIVFVKHAYNYGLGIVREGVEKYAKGEYIAVHHSDDTWREDKLEKQVAYLDANPDCYAVFSGVQVINDDDSLYQKEDNFYFKIFNQENRSRFEWLRFFFFKGNCLCHPSALVRKKAYSECNMFGHACRQIPDLIMWTRICMKYDIYIYPEKLTFFRIHENEKRNSSGFSIDNNNRNMTELFWYRKLFLDITDENEFLQIFPEWKEYSVEGVFDNQYALARICLLPNNPDYTKHFGLYLMHELYENDEKRKLLQEKYKIDNREYKRLCGLYDVFHTLPLHAEQCMTIYYGTSNKEFSKENTKEIRYALTNEHRFCYQVKLNVGEWKNSILYFRLDPAENVFISSEIEEFRVNGTVVKLWPSNSSYLKDGKAIFFDLDPQYVSEQGIEVYDEELVIEISGRISRISECEIGRYVQGTSEEKLLPRTKQFLTVYWRTSEEDFALEKSVRIYYHLLEEKKLRYNLKICEDNSKKLPLYFRLDPAEAVFVKCRLEPFIVNGNRINLNATNGYMKQKDGRDVFLNTDPIYMSKGCFDLQGEMEIEFGLELERVSETQITEYIDNSVSKKIKRYIKNLRKK